MGFSEIKPLSQIGRTITILIIVSGITVLTYTLGQIFRIFLEGELLRILGRKKLEKQITGLSNHFIICRYGRIGAIISQELAAEGIRFVVIENDPKSIAQLEKDHMLYLNMDAASEEALVKAGIMRAKGQGYRNSRFIRCRQCFHYPDRQRTATGYFYFIPGIR